MYLLTLLVAIWSIWPWQFVEHYKVINADGEVLAEQCHALTFKHSSNAAKLTETPLPDSFELLVWNVYKQNRDGLETELVNYAKSADLVALQEVVMDDDYLSVVEGGWHLYQAVAFWTERQQKYAATGVSLWSRVPPQKLCGWWFEEPWLPFPKTALLSSYRLSSGQVLWLVNIHAINFTAGVIDYQTQLSEIIELLNYHSGPIIVTGDFNNWNEKRQHAVKRLQSELDLMAVSWEPDHRVRFFGRPIDHVLYRGLSVESSRAELTRASDHGPLRVRFGLIGESM